MNFELKELTSFNHSCPTTVSGKCGPTKQGPTRCLIAHLFMVFLFVFQTGFLCVALTTHCTPGTHSVDQAGLKLTEICPPLTAACCLPSARIKGESHYTFISALLKDRSPQATVTLDLLYSLGCPGSSSRVVGLQLASFVGW